MKKMMVTTALVILASTAVAKDLVVAKHDNWTVRLFERSDRTFCALYSEVDDKGLSLEFDADGTVNVVFYLSVSSFPDELMMWVQVDDNNPHLLNTMNKDGSTLAWRRASYDLTWGAITTDMLDGKSMVYAYTIDGLYLGLGWSLKGFAEGVESWGDCSKMIR